MLFYITFSTLNNSTLRRHSFRTSLSQKSINLIEAECAAMTMLTWLLLLMVKRIMFLYQQDWLLWRGTWGQSKFVSALFVFHRSFIVCPYYRQAVAGWLAHGWDYQFFSKVSANQFQNFLHREKRT